MKKGLSRSIHVKAEVKIKENKIKVLENVLPPRSRVLHGVATYLILKEK